VGTLNFVRSELDLHVAIGCGMEGWGLGGLSAVIFCCGRACESMVC
jgi:hypothetical protein